MAIAGVGANPNRPVGTSLSLFYILFSDVLASVKILSRDISVHFGPVYLIL